MIIFFTYHVSSFDQMPSSQSVALFNNTISLMMITRANNDFSFEPFVETPSIGTNLFFGFLNFQIHLP